MPDMHDTVLVLDPSSEDGGSIWGAVGSIFRALSEAKQWSRANREELWVVPHAGALSAGAFWDLKSSHLRKALLLFPLPEERRQFLHHFFGTIVSPDASLRLMAEEDIAEALAAPHRRDLFIGGAVSREDEAVILYRGDLETLVVPLSWFQGGPRSPEPDFTDFEVIDGGQAVRFGEFEAATSAILYEHDPDYRRQEKKRRLSQDNSLGASIRRLRLQKGRRLADMRCISEKEMARIERGEVKPREETLGAIAQELGVPREAIGTF